VIIEERDRVVDEVIERRVGEGFGLGG